MLPDQDVLIIDDFLASGQTLRALVRMVDGARSRVAGVGVVVEKTFEGGRNFMRSNTPSHRSAVHHRQHGQRENPVF
jgi:adenine/guanine phosphoribosyltransferase-like PRPP-binding protein